MDKIREEMLTTARAYTDKGEELVQTLLSLPSVRERLKQADQCSEAQEKAARLETMWREKCKPHRIVDETGALEHCDLLQMRIDHLKARKITGQQLSDLLLVTVEEDIDPKAWQAAADLITSHFTQDVSNPEPKDGTDSKKTSSPNKASADPLVIPPVHVIYKNNKPYGIRDGTGFLLFFPDYHKYSGQDERYRQEVEQQYKLADHLLKALHEA